MLLHWSALDHRRDRLADIDHVFSNIFNELSPRAATRRPQALAFSESEDAYTITAAAPGVAGEDVAVSFEAGVLTVRFARTVAAQDGFEVLRRERGDIRVTQSLRLPGPVSADGIAARLVNGLLTVTAPKAPEAKPRRIAVETA